MKINSTSRTFRMALMGAMLVAAVALVSTSSAASSAAPKACAAFTKAIAATLIKEQPKTVLDSPLSCIYGRSSERAATMKTTVTFSIVKNPSVSAARTVQRNVEKVAPKKAPPGLTAFARGRLSFPDGEATYVYFKQPGGPLTGGYVFLRIGAYTAQLTPEVLSPRPSFTASDLKKAASQIAANWS